MNQQERLDMRRKLKSLKYLKLSKKDKWEAYKNMTERNNQVNSLVRGIINNFSKDVGNG